MRTDRRAACWVSKPLVSGDDDLIRGGCDLLELSEHEINCDE